MLDVTTIILFLTVFTLACWALGSHPANLPPGPTRWPLIGYIPKKKMSDTVAWIRDMRSTYGDMWTVWRGNHPMVFIAGPKLMREALVDKADFLSERPGWMHANKLINKGQGIVWSKDWKPIRKFVLNSLRDFGAGAASLEGKILLECEELSKEFCQKDGAPFDCHDVVVNAVSNVICSIIFGKRYDYDDVKFKHIMDVMDHAFRAAPIKSSLNYFPWLARIAFHLGLGPFRHMSQAQMEVFIQAELQTHRQAFEPGHVQDFLDIYLQSEHCSDEELQISGSDLLRAVSDLFAAGTETTATTLQWLLVYMINFPHLQKKCREEILKVVGPDRPPRMTDRSSLVYTEATLLETQRMANIAPVSLPHSCHVDVEVGGYTIPKDAVVYAVLGSAHEDQTEWKDPSEFRPERWIHDGKVEPKHNAFMPFSLGRRQCPGEHIARMELFLFAVTFLQQFEFKVADKMPSLEGHIGLTRTPWPFKISAVPLSV